MEHLVYIVVLIVVVGIVLAATGWWRLALVPFRIRPARMDVARLGLTVAPDDVERVEGVLRSFAGGFNAMLTGPRWSMWQRYCDSLPVFLRPFAHEGAAMGFTPRRFFRCRPEDFEESVVRTQPGMRYLYYVGLGFWSAMRDHHPRHLAHVVARLDLLHGHLCYDGYGFKHGFFDYLENPEVVRKFDNFDESARNVVYQGVGRSFWFLFGGDRELLIERIVGLGEYARHVAGGVGLAAVFVHPDRLEAALELGGGLPPEWHDDYHLGACFGLKARSINDAEQFERDVSRLDPGVCEAVQASVHACDRIEQQVRDERGKDGYPRWRDRVSEWMAGHIEFPLAGMQSSSPSEKGVKDLLPERPAGCLAQETPDTLFSGGNRREETEA